MARSRKPKLPLPWLVALLVLGALGAYFLPGGLPQALPPKPAQLPEESWSAGPGLVTLHSIDVGQGDATLVVFPNGKTLLVDAGNNGKGKIVLDYLQSAGVDHLDWMVATNPDADHVGGMDEVLDGLPVKAFLDPGSPCTTKTCLDNEEALARHGVTKTFAHRSEALDLGGGFKVGILNPTKPLSFDKENNNSVVLFVDTQGEDFLLPGDCEKECERQLAEAYGDRLKADIYKAGHHGSRTSSSAEYLDKIGPALALISAGKNNRYGHPHPEVLERFKERGIRVLRTDKLGNLKVYSDPAEGCCAECRAGLSQDPRGVGPSGIACASYGEKLSLLCGEYFTGNPKSAADCLG